MNRLKQLRTENNLTQEELGKLIGVSKRTIIAWEKSEQLSIKTEKAQQLANKFGVSVPYLLGYDELELSLKEAESLVLANLEVNNNIAYESSKLYKDTLSSILELLDLLKKKAKSGDLKTETLIATIETIENFTNSLDKTIQTAIDSQIKDIELNRLKNELESSKEKHKVK